ncbi:MAG: hypothetical protein HZB20_04245 [Chloroflexi bacterium]|nr:hypothetical protein [Chloroflexota bacterium]
MSEESLLSQRYKIISQIGAGGMAIVLKAQDLSLGRTVAVKPTPASSPCTILAKTPAATSW